MLHSLCKDEGMNVDVLASGLCKAVIGQVTAHSPALN